ncbi:MAG: DNA polymerase III subunit delta [Anaerolineae bacterium]|nr:DNA polymerase III subunit delta [Anaerolineae bacterium]
MAGQTFALAIGGFPGYACPDRCATSGPIHSTPHHHFGSAWIPGGRGDHEQNPGPHDFEPHRNKRLDLADEGPEIYLFDGDDEFAINASIAKIISHLGEPSIADMNTIRLDGRLASLAQLKDATASVPFLASRRLVILTHPTARYREKSEQQEFIGYLANPKPTAKLLLVEYDFLTKDKFRKVGKLHWLEKWALSPEQAHRVFVRHHSQPGGALMVKWIQDNIKAAGGQITTPGAVALASQVGDDTRLASQEIDKLLTYTSFSRPVDEDDVAHLTPLTARIGDFDLVNAIRDRDQRRSQALLHRSLQDEDPLRIFSSIIFQIRALLVAREILDEHGTVDEFPRSLKISYYPAKIAMESANRFSAKFLEHIYHRLLDFDEAIKSSQMEPDLALELLVVELTS